MAVNKVVYNTENGAETLIDLTGDSVTPETLAKGATAHDASGNVIEGALLREVIVTATASGGELTNVSHTFDEIYDAYTEGQNIRLHIYTSSGSTVILQCTNIDADNAFFSATTTAVGENFIHSVRIFSDGTSTYTSSTVGNVDKAYLVTMFEELKTALKESNLDAAIAVLDKAILDFSALA